MMISMMNLAIIAIARSDVTMHNRALVAAHGGVNIIPRSSLCQQLQCFMCRKKFFHFYQTLLMCKILTFAVVLMAG